MLYSLFNDKFGISGIIILKFFLKKSNIFEYDVIPPIDE